MSGPWCNCIECVGDQPEPPVSRGHDPYNSIDAPPNADVLEWKVPEDTIEVIVL